MPIFDRDFVSATALELGITDIPNATIGQSSMLATALERRTGVEFVRMDQGVPSLEPCRIGIEAEKAALDKGVAAIYTPPEGIEPLKRESARFVKAFTDIDVRPEGCIPVTGSVTGSFGSFIMCNALDPERDTVLFIDPGFPIQKSQLRVLGYKWESFDIYAFRGGALGGKLESILSKGNISAIIYSNPNNPAWICLTEEELKTIGGLATKYEAIVLEDLAYFCMDFRSPLGLPFTSPYQATVARYTENWILMLSGSKIFSYAGQRIAFIAISDTLFDRRYPALAERFGGTGEFGATMVNAVLYMITSGSTHSVQYGMAGMLRAASDGRYSFTEETREYERRARRMKEIFAGNGFYVVYDRDADRSIGDGFFFSAGYPGMRSGELMRELMAYGISSISLATTGSLQQGIRACSSRMAGGKLALLRERLEMFKREHQ